VSWYGVSLSLTRFIGLLVKTANACRQPLKTLSNLALKVLRDSAFTISLGKLFHILTVL